MNSATGGAGRSKWRVVNWSRTLILLVTLCAVACDATAGDAAPSPSGGAPVGAVLHRGQYCQSMQVAGDGGRTLPVGGGCQFYMTAPSDLFATDRADYSVSKVIGSADLGVQGPPDAKAMVICRLQPRGLYWFWIGADGGWNIDSVADVHQPVDLVGAAQVNAMKHYINVGKINQLAFQCSGSAPGEPVTLTLSVNGTQFAVLHVPLSPSQASRPLERAATPWFVDLGARLTSAGTLQATVSKLTLYDER